jgi:hypothetical protein
LLLLVTAKQAIDRAPVALGGTACARSPYRRKGRGRFGGIGSDRPEQSTRIVGRTAPLGKAHNPKNAHGTVERNGNDIAGPHRAARGIDPNAVDPHVTTNNERSRRRARAHYPCVPQPFVDPLPVQGLSLVKAFAPSAVSLTFRSVSRRVRHRNVKDKPH